MTLTSVTTGLSAEATEKLAKANKLADNLTAGEAYAVTVQIDLAEGETAEDRMQHLIEAFTVDVCLSQMIQRIVHNMQGHIRGLIAAGKTEDEIQNAIFDLDNEEFIWKIGVPRSRKSDADKLIDAVSSAPEALTEAQKDRMRELLGL